MDNLINKTLTRHIAKNKTRTSPEIKIEIIKNMMSNGYDVNKITALTKFTYEGKQYNVGNWLYNAKQGKGGDTFIHGLIGLGFMIDKKKRTTVSNEMKREILLDMMFNGIDVYNLPSNYVYNYLDKEYNVGNWLMVAKQGCANQEILSDLRELGFDLDARQRVSLSPEKKLIILKDMISKGIDINELGYKSVYEYYGRTYNVGVWLSVTKQGNGGQVFREGLNEIGFDLNANRYVKPKQKLIVLQDMINNGYDINKIKGSDYYIYKGQSYHVGVWLAMAKQNRHTQEFVDGLHELGFDLKHRISDTYSEEV